MEKSSDRIKQLRTQQNYTQRQLADYLGISQSLYAKYESGDRNIKLSQLIKLCDVYGCQEEYILYGEGKSENTLMFQNKKMDLKTITKMNKICRNLKEMIQLNEKYFEN